VAITEILDEPNHFVPLSVSELVSCLQDAVVATEVCSMRDSINTFLDFYAWE
jgi:hypothetical protein